ncbi:hypothetical protein CK203_101778 [Vitis vinifera]|uniref:Uncharacterized protein n=1 Tax=Vitis vinifera TaxID=29760 RepID=A0A438FB24_VITVI|nr:hypothetical protein CK203_101778 [Vitis vinifera]
MQGPDTSGWTSVYDMRLSDVGVVQIDVSCFHMMQGGGESRDQVYQRCTLSLKRIGSKHKGNLK